MLKVLNRIRGKSLGFFSTVAVFYGTILIIAIPGVPHADERKIKATIEIKEEYNDNIYYDDDDEIDDFVTTATPSIRIINNTERLKLDVNLQLVGVKYHDNEDLDCINQFYDIDYAYKISEKTEISGAMGYSVDSLNDRDILATGVVLDNETHYRQNYSLLLNHTISEATSNSFSVAFNDDETKQDTFRTYSAGYNLASAFRMLERPSFWRLQTGYTRFDYTDSSTDNLFLTLGIEQELSEVWRLTADLGPRYTRSEFDTYQRIPGYPFFVPVTQDEDEFGLRAVITAHRTFEDGMLKFNFIHDTSGAAGIDGAFENTEIRIDAVKRFSQATTGYLLVRAFRKTADRVDVNFADIDETTFALSSNLRYMISDNLFAKIGYMFTYIDNRESGTSSIQNRGYIALSWEDHLLQ